MRLDLRRIAKTVLAASIFAVACSPSWVSAFEGVISFKSNYWGESSEFQYSTKEGRSRIDTRRVRHGRAAVIMDLEALKVSMLLLNVRLAMVMNLDASALLRPASTDRGLVRTGKRKIVLGYPAEQRLHSGEEEDVEMWGTTELGIFMGLHPTSSMFGRRGGAPAWERAMIEQKLFPLIVIRKDKKGQEIGRLEAIGIEHKVIPDSLFEIPRWYLTYDKFDPKNKVPGMPGTVWVK